MFGAVATCHVYSEALSCSSFSALIFFKDEKLVSSVYTGNGQSTGSMCQWKLSPWGAATISENVRSLEQQTVFIGDEL